MLFSLDQKNILITSASSGIGEECSVICSELGANLILMGRDQNKLKRTLKKLKQGNHIILSHDLMDIEGIEATLSDSLVNYSQIHGFIHSAGIDVTKPIQSLRQIDYNKIFNVNITSGFEIARILSKNKFNSTGASFIFISSVMSIVGESGKIAYSASKGGLLSGCRSMAVELSSKKIRVNCISPAIVKTDLTEKLLAELPGDSVKKIESMHLLGFGSPKDIAHACVFLLSDEAKWITGSNLVIDGGYSCR